MEKSILLALLLTAVGVMSMRRTQSPPHIVVVHTAELPARDEMGCFPFLSLVLAVITALVLL